MTSLAQEIRAWIEISIPKLDCGELSQFDFDVLRQLVVQHQPKRRALVLFSRDPHLNADIVAWTDPAVRDPTAESGAPPYDTILAAITDGWELISTPTASNDSAADSAETGIVGFEYILHRKD